MKSVLSVLLVLGVSGVFAQTGSISGVVKDGSDQTPMEFTRVALFSSKDSSLVDGTISNVDGSFKLDKLPMDVYYLDIKFIGYQTRYISNIELKKEASNVNLSSIVLELGQKLNDVEVVAEKNFSEVKLDKKIFNADQSLAKNGGTGLDLMREIPSITVDENDNILLRGDANVTILIDGRPTSMPANELLKQFPAASIEKVELITNPSAKYDPEGMSGIINIVLKKNKLKGFTGNTMTSVGYGSLPKLSAGVGLNYRNSKLNIYSNYNYSYRETWFGGNQTRNILLGDTLWDRLRTEDLGGRVNTSHFGRAGLDYFINDKNTVYLSGTISRGSNLGTRDINYQNVDNQDNLLYRSFRNGQIDSPSENYGINTGWQKTFNRPDHTLDFDLNYNTSSRLGDERLFHNYYDESDQVYLTAYQNTLDENNNSVLLGKVDYTLPINDSLTIESGFHFTGRQALSNFFSESGISDADLIPDIALNNGFDYDQNTYAAYFTIGRQFKKLGAKIGVRAEQTMTMSTLVNTNENFENDYFKLFPSAHLSYKTEKKGEFQLSYSKRINRPEMYQLNPFSNYSDPLTLNRGNPFLRPEIIHVNELSYLKFWKKFNINATVYHRMITNLIRRSLSYEETLSVVSYSNLGGSTLSGGDLNLTYTPIKGLRIMSNTSVWAISTDEVEFTGGKRLYYIGVNSSLRASKQMQKGFSGQIWASYSPRQDVIQGEIIPNYGGGIGLNKRVLNSKGNIGVTVYDVFKTRQFSFNSDDLGDYMLTSTRRWESRSIYVSFNYNFGKMTQGKQRREGKSLNSGDDAEVPGM